MTKEEIIRKAANNLIFMGQILTPKDFYLPTPDFHYEMSDLLINRSIRQLMIQAPRGTGKSTLAILTVLNHIIYDEGDKVVVIQSKTRKEALKRLRTIKTILEGKTFADIYGIINEKTATIWCQDEIKFRLGKHWVYIAAIGTGMPMRGILEDGTRLTLYYNDDIEDEDNTKTEESLDFNFSKFLGNLFGLDVRTGRCIVVGTPITANCVVDRLDGASDWVTRKYCAKGEFIDGDYNEDSEEVLWPEMYSTGRLIKIKQGLFEQGMIYKYYSDYCCSIRGDDEQIFKKEYLQYYDGALEIIDKKPYLRIIRENFEDLLEPKLVPISINIGVDPASSIERTADYPVIFPIGISIDEDIYCLPYSRERMLPTEFADKIIDTFIETKAHRCNIETTGYQEGLRDILERERKKRGISIRGLNREEGFQPNEQKKKRLREGLHSYFYHKKVWLKENMFEFKSELLGFPRGLKHDDLLDGFYYATRRLQTPSHTVPVKKEFKFYPLEEEFIGNNKNWMLN